MIFPVLLVGHAFQMQTVLSDGCVSHDCSCVAALRTCVTVFNPQVIQAKGHSASLYA